MHKNSFMKIISKLKLLKKRKLPTSLIIFKFLETNVDSIEIRKEFTLINMNKITKVPKIN